METVVTILDNQKLLKPQVLKDGELEPFFKVRKENTPGKEELENLPEDFTNLANSFDSEADYKKALKR